MAVQVVCLAWLPCDAGSLAVTTIELIALYCDIRNAKIRPPPINTKYLGSVAQRYSNGGDQQLRTGGSWLPGNMVEDETP